MNITGSSGRVNRTKWSAVRSVTVWLVIVIGPSWALSWEIERVILKSDKREARDWFEITSTIIPWIERQEVQLLINRIYNKFRN